MMAFPVALFVGAKGVLHDRRRWLGGLSLLLAVAAILYWALAVQRFVCW
jgi:hypothetical protein